MKKAALILFLTLFVFVSNTQPILAKGGGGGGHASSGGRASSFGSRSSAPKAVAAKPRTPQQIKADTAAKVKADAAVAKQKVQESKYQQAAAKQPITKKVAGKTYTKGSTVGVNGYTPRFTGGYHAPAGSVVYYQNSSSMWDWLPLYYIMTHNGNQQAVVQQPDGKQQTVQEEGGDGMYIVNWIITILLGLGIIGAIVYFVNKYTRKGVKYNY